MRTEGAKIAAIARATALSRPTVYRLLADLADAVNKPA
jgi:DNA-binding IclR family transcriptional regulator